MSNTYYSGLDMFTPDPNEYEEMFCKVCSRKMLVKRNVEGYRSYAEAMGKHKSKFDQFHCALHDRDWHKKAANLMIEAGNFRSQTLRDIVLAEAEELVKEHMNE